MSATESIAQNLALIRERMVAAAVRAGRGPDSITLMAVSKTVAPELIAEAHAAGVRCFGENRVQEFAEKLSRLQHLAEAKWRLIGHLQSNKAKKAVELFQTVDSVDSLTLARKLDQAAAQAGRQLEVLLEINIGGEESKAGLAANSPELEQILQAAPELEHLKISGLMTVPPYTEDPEGARPWFRGLRQLRESITARHLPAIRMDVLSMGMSHDFEVAIEEGSTCVRVGSAIFGSRPKP